MGMIRGAAAAASVLAVAGCMSSGGEGVSLGERLLHGGAVSAAMSMEDRDVYCPPVGVMEGGAALQSAGAGGVRSAISLGQLARECVGRPDGSTIVKVGVEGRAVFAAAGGGRFDVPVRVVVTSGGTVLANRARRATVTVPSGDTQGGFVLVEEGLVVPASAAKDFEIEVGLGGAAAGRQR